MASTPPANQNFPDPVHHRTVLPVDLEQAVIDKTDPAESPEPNDRNTPDAMHDATVAETHVPKKVEEEDLARDFENEDTLLGNFDEANLDDSPEFNDDRSLFFYGADSLFPADQDIDIEGAVSFTNEQVASFQNRNQDLNQEAIFLDQDPDTRFINTYYSDPAIPERIGPEFKRISSDPTKKADLNKLVGLLFDTPTKKNIEAMGALIKKLFVEDDKSKFHAFLTELRSQPLTNSGIYNNERSLHVIQELRAHSHNALRAKTHVLARAKLAEGKLSEDLLRLVSYQSVRIHLSSHENSDRIMTMESDANEISHLKELLVKEFPELKSDLDTYSDSQKDAALIDLAKEIALSSMPKELNLALQDIANNSALDASSVENSTAAAYRLIKQERHGEKLSASDQQAKVVHLDNLVKQIRGRLTTEMRDDLPETTFNFIDRDFAEKLLLEIIIEKENITARTIEDQVYEAEKKAQTGESGFSYRNFDAAKNKILASAKKNGFPQDADMKEALAELGIDASNINLSNEFSNYSILQTIIRAYERLYNGGDQALVAQRQRAKTNLRWTAGLTSIGAGAWGLSNMLGGGPVEPLPEVKPIVSTEDPTAETINNFDVKIASTQLAPAEKVYFDNLLSIAESSNPKIIHLTPSTDDVHIDTKQSSGINPEALEDVFDSQALVTKLQSYIKAYKGHKGEFPRAIAFRDSDGKEHVITDRVYATTASDRSGSRLRIWYKALLRDLYISRETLGDITNTQIKELPGLINNSYSEAQHQANERIDNESID